MSNDHIVEELRECATHAGGEGYTCGVMRRAAAEIKRLSGKVDLTEAMWAEACSLATERAIQRDALAAELQALKAQMAGQEPAGWQARFTSSGDERDEWRPCSKEHYELVKRCPTEWPGYEVREVFAAPPAAQDVIRLREALEFACKSLAQVTSADGSGHAQHCQCCAWQA